MDDACRLTEIIRRQKSCGRTAGQTAAGVEFHRRRQEKAHPLDETRIDPQVASNKTTIGFILLKFK